MTSTPTIPRYALLDSSTFSFVISSSIIGFAVSIGIAYPIPSTEVSEYFTELIPITSPAVFNNAPPLLPWLIAASVWISSAV